MEGRTRSQSKQLSSFKKLLHMISNAAAPKPKTEKASVISTILILISVSRMKMNTKNSYGKTLEAAHTNTRARGTRAQGKWASSRTHPIPLVVQRG